MEIGTQVWFMRDLEVVAAEVSSLMGEDACEVCSGALPYPVYKPNKCLYLSERSALEALVGYYHWMERRYAYYAQETVSRISLL